ncbi:MAG: DUF2934 domain-containing protein [Inquilinaceae bacterium]
MKEPNDDDIRQRAYFIWDQAGRPHGMAKDHWLQAKWELTNEAAVNNGAGATPKSRTRKAAAPKSAAAKSRKAPKTTKPRTAAASGSATSKAKPKAK